MEMIILYVGFTLLALVAILKRSSVYNALSTTREVLGKAQFYILQAVVNLVQRIVWRINGVQEQLVKAETGTVTATSVHVQHIIHRGVLSAFNHPRPWDFIGLHESFTHPGVLLEANVTLYCITETHAYFVETPSNIAVHHSSTSPFFYMAQFAHAVRLFSVPLKEFHKSADELGDPAVPVVWISNTGRCGSTLLLQMLEQLPGIRCFSEPDSLTNIDLMSKAGQMDPEGITRALRSAIRFICKPAAGVQRIAVKPRFNCVTEVEEVMALFPEFKHIYMYRHIGNTMKSYYKLMHRDLAVCVLEHLVNSPFVSRFIPYVRSYLYHFVSGEEHLSKASRDGLEVDQINFMGWATLVLLSPITEFKKIQERRSSEIPTLHYDHLMARPTEVTTAMFKWLDLPQDDVQKALKAMEHDTQAGTMLSNISNTSDNIRKMTSRDTNDMNVMLKLMGIPDMTEEIELPIDIECMV